MSQPPNRIWLQWYGDDDDSDFNEPNQVLDKVTWCVDQIFPNDREYVIVPKPKEEDDE